jgi:hypothetical protein
MKRWPSMLLLLAALLGLLGQEAAFGQAMPVAKVGQAVASLQMSPECAEMTGLAKQAQQPEKPCQGMTPDCTANMGCAVPVALLPPLAFGAVPPFRAALPTPLSIAPLVGLETGPEPDPPTLLG